MLIERVFHCSAIVHDEVIHISLSLSDFSLSHFLIVVHSELPIFPIFVRVANIELRIRKFIEGTLVFECRLFFLSSQLPRSPEYKSPVHLEFTETVALSIVESASVDLTIRTSLGSFLDGTVDPLALINIAIRLLKSSLPIWLVASELSFEPFSISEDSEALYELALFPEAL